MQGAKEQQLLAGGKKRNTGANLGRLGLVGGSGENGANQGMLRVVGESGANQGRLILLRLFLGQGF